MLRTFRLSHMPPELALHAALYQDVRNAAFLREQLLAGNAEFEYAFIDASTVLSTTHVLAAAFRAMNDYQNGRLKSRNVHSEIVFALSPNNNIAESFRKFGVNDQTQNLLVLKVATTPTATAEHIQKHLKEAIKGTCVAFDDASLSSTTNINNIRKIYKLPAPPKPKSGTARDIDEILGGERKELEVNVLGAMALRGAT